MSFKAKLNIDGEEFLVMNVSYSLQRDKDFSGRVSSDVRGGTIHFEIQGSDKTLFYDWMADSHAKKDGSFVFYKREDDAVMKEIEFTNAYIVDYAESFSHVGKNPLVENVTISAEKLKIGGSTIDNKWAA